ncbi:hypothetical protein A2U01_0118437, partial [Trifolium medium]|nr:hypothetical protein [Trifolium medium]
SEAVKPLKLSEVLKALRGSEVVKF